MPLVDRGQPPRRLSIRPRPMVGVVGWMAAFVFLFVIFGPGRVPSGGAPRGDAAGSMPVPAAEGARLLPATPPVPPRAPDVLTIGIWQAPRGVFNPLFSDDPGDREVNALLFETLLSPGADLRPGPNLAADYAVAPDQQAITFRLRPDARWHDGTPVTADDVAFTLETVLHREYQGPYAGRFRYIQGARAFHEGRAAAVSGISVEGPLEVRIALERPYGPALAELGSLPVLPRHAFAGLTPGEMADAPASREAPVGSGPFRLLEEPRPVIPGAGGEGDPAARAVSDVQLVAFPDFFRGPPRLRAVRFRVVGPRLDLARLRAEGIDLVRVRREDGETVRRAGYALREWPERGYHYLGVNMGRAALRDRRVRQALAYALDRAAMLREVYAGHGTLVHAPVFPGSWAEAPGLNPYPFDRERAARLLEEAGWRDTDGDGIRERGGGRLTLTLLYRKDQDVDGRLARLVGEYLRAVGVDVQARGLGAEDLLRWVFGFRDFDLYLSGWELDLDPDVSEVFGSRARVNAVGFRQGDGEDLLAQAAELVDLSRREPLYREWTRRVNEELPYICLFTPNQLLAVSPRVRGVQATPLGYARGAEAWWVTP